MMAKLCSQWLLFKNKKIVHTIPWGFPCRKLKSCPDTPASRKLSYMDSKTFPSSLDFYKVLLFSTGFLTHASTQNLGIFVLQVKAELFNPTPPAQKLAEGGEGSMALNEHFNQLLNISRKLTLALGCLSSRCNEKI